MHIVAPEADADRVRKEMDRPTFRHVLDGEHSTLQFLSSEAVRERYKTVEEAGALQQVI